MERETGILQQRIQPVAVERRGEQALERVRGKQREAQKTDRDQRLDAQHARA